MTARYAIADGRITIGRVERTAGCYVATDVAGHIIGRFMTLREASRAFGRSAGKAS